MLELDAMGEKQPKRTSSGTRPINGRILVVDDDLFVGDAVALILADAHAVTVVNRAEEALDLITRGERYDVILCDVMMPVMSGADLHARMTAVAPTEAARMVFVTGCAVVPEVRAFLDRVPNTCLEKPFEVDAFRAFIERRVRAEHEQTSSRSRVR
jgi:CheY-like chemotaxis protein